MLKVLLKEGRSSNFTSTEVENVKVAAQATGVDPAWIAGMLKVESGGDCRARAFNNDHLRKKARKHGESYSALVNAGLHIGTAKEGRKSYSDHKRSNSYFERAFKIAPKAAIEVSAWGTYQVMGWELLRLSGGDPHKAKKMFFDDPCGMSIKLFISWIKQAGPSFVNAANMAIATGQRRYFARTVRKYYGKASAKYIDLVIKYSNKFENKHTTKNKVYLLGDSNTVAHSRYWRAFAAKNFGLNTHLINYSVNGYSLLQILDNLNSIKSAAGIIIGSGGGNDVVELGRLKNPEQIKRKIAPGSPFYNKRIVPLMEKLREFQDSGTRVVFYGLPFGRGSSERCTDNTPIARQAMDEALQTAASGYHIPYYSVFEQTKKIKGAKCGRHYGNKQAYKDALRGVNPDQSPAAEEELKYARSITGGKRIKLGYNKFLSPYRYIQKAGITFDKFYKDLEAAFGSSWENTMLPRLGADKIFGPEHFAALAKLAQKKQDSKLLALVRQKSPNKEEPVIAKAEESAFDKIAGVLKKAVGINESENKNRKQKIRIILKS